MAIDSALFRSVLGRFASGVTVVTTRDAQGVDHGMTVSAFCSLSLDPLLILICVEACTSIHPVLMDSDCFVVNILSADQEAMSRRFAAHVKDRFEGLGYSRGVTGAVILNDVLAHLECRRSAHYPGGDHTIFVGEVVDAEAHSDRPLLYYRGGYAQFER
jgi:flavin reductase (DIM6/NTAB) family NADH-FMN oxidoreductase RutF